jgi:hypothetical protein
MDAEQVSIVGNVSPVIATLPMMYPDERSS